MKAAPQSRWRRAWLVYTRPSALRMLFLGFSAGLPFMLVFATLTAWLRDAGVSRTAIGFFAWIGITYSIKVFWSPVIDRLGLPLLTKMFGQRRGWMNILVRSGNPSRSEEHTSALQSRDHLVCRLLL